MEKLEQSERRELFDTFFDAMGKLESYFSILSYGPYDVSQHEYMAQLIAIRIATYVIPPLRCFMPPSLKFPMYKHFTDLDDDTYDEDIMIEEKWEFFWSVEEYASKALDIVVENSHWNCVFLSEIDEIMALSDEQILYLQENIFQMLEHLRRISPEESVQALENRLAALDIDNYSPYITNALCLILENPLIREVQKKCEENPKYKEIDQLHDELSSYLAVLNKYTFLNRYFPTCLTRAVSVETSCLVYTLGNYIDGDYDEMSSLYYTNFAMLLALFLADQVAEELSEKIKKVEKKF